MKDTLQTLKTKILRRIKGLGTNRDALIADLEVGETDKAVFPQIILDVERDASMRIATLGIVVEDIDILMQVDKKGWDHE